MKRLEIYQKLSRESNGAFEYLPPEEQKKQVDIQYLGYLLVRIFLKRKEKQAIPGTEQTCD